VRETVDSTELEQIVAVQYDVLARPGRYRDRIDRVSKRVRPPAANLLRCGGQRGRIDGPGRGECADRDRGVEAPASGVGDVLEKEREPSLSGSPRNCSRTNGINSVSLLICRLTRTSRPRSSSASRYCRRSPKDSSVGSLRRFPHRPKRSGLMDGGHSLTLADERG